MLNIPFLTQFVGGRGGIYIYKDYDDDDDDDNYFVLTTYTY